MRYKLGDKQPKKKQGHIPTLLSAMEENRWYKIEEIKKIAQKLELSASTINNLLNYGVKKQYIIPETEFQITHTSDSQNFPDHKLSTEVIVQQIEAFLQELEQIKQERMIHEQKIAKLKQEIEQENDILAKLNLQERRLQQILRPFTQV